MGCSSEDDFSKKKITLKANGIYKVYKDIDVTFNETSFDGVPYTRITISAKPSEESDAVFEVFSIALHRGGALDGESVNGAYLLNDQLYYYNFDQPINLNLSVNNEQRIKGTFEGMFTNDQGENVMVTEGKIDITYDHQ